MLFKFKILLSEKEPKILGMFGDCIKVRLSKYNDFTSFFAGFLGCGEDMITVVKENKIKSIIELDLPDASYEIIMSWIENK